MRHIVLSCLMVLCAPLACAFEIEDHARFGPEDAAQTLRILSTTDTRFFAPVIESYLAARPTEAVDYSVASSAQVMAAIYDESAPFDLVISSAMDLQTKLANDGFAQRHQSSITQALPGWAVWNDMVFAFTQEPAAIVVSNDAFADLPIPRSRQDLIRLMRQNPARFRGRVGTYDIRQSGLGYLFATQDTRASETYWRLTEVMGALDARLYCCSSKMIDAVETGELAIAYNVLGSYALNRVDQSSFSIILPDDFTTVMLRSVLIPRNAPSPKQAQGFVDHMLQNTRHLQHEALSETSEAALHRIALGPGLLVFLDQLKKRAFLAEWESAIVQE